MKTSSALRSICKCAQSVTRATRSPGKHRIAWDGFDDKGQPLPPGTYTLFLEVNREHGTHATESGKIVCGKSPAKGSITGVSFSKHGRAGCTSTSRCSACSR